METSNQIFAPNIYTHTYEFIKKTLKELKSGQIPEYWKTGIEAEGCLYDKNGKILNIEDNNIKKEYISHSEYHLSTLEVATNPIFSGKNYASSIAKNFSETIAKAYNIAQHLNALLVFSSSFELGEWSELKINNDTHINKITSNNLFHAKNHLDRIPKKTISVYKLFDKYFDEKIRDCKPINYPIHSIQVHSGLPLINGLIDSKFACVNIQLKNSLIAKIVSLILFNTNQAFGKNLREINVNFDVRSILRRISPLSLGQLIPDNSLDLINLVNYIETKPNKVIDIGTLDRVRFRYKNFKTIESIDAPMNPDLRICLGWIFFNKLLEIFALELMEETKGNEELAYKKIKKDLFFKPVPTIFGKYSAVNIEFNFNTNYWDSKLNINGYRLKEVLSMFINEISILGTKYPVIKPMCSFLQLIINNSVLPSKKTDSISEYMGIKNNQYCYNNKNNGILSLSKEFTKDTSLLSEQHNGTYIQSLAFQKLRDDYDLLTILK